MLNVDIDEQNRVAVLSVEGQLSELDFRKAANVIDPYIDEFGHLNGLIISTKTFPGWESFAALLSHLKFVKDHHKKITFVAFVTDSPLGELAERIASHFVAAKIKGFNYDDLALAIEWIVESND